jgi:hypothetical protein
MVVERDMLGAERLDALGKRPDRAGVRLDLGLREHDP